MAYKQTVDTVVFFNPYAREGKRILLKHIKDFKNTTVSPAMGLD